MPQDAEDFVTTVLGEDGKGGRTLSFAAIDLLVIDGPDRGARVRIAGGVTRVGTSSSNQLRLSDRAVSRVHCELRLRNNVVHIVDAGSTNGTFAEGVRIIQAEMAPGGVFRVGATAIRLEAADSPTRVPVS